MKLSVIMRSVALCYEREGSALFGVVDSAQRKRRTATTSIFFSPVKASSSPSGQVLIMCYRISQINRLVRASQNMSATERQHTLIHLA